MQKGANLCLNLMLDSHESLPNFATITHIFKANNKDKKMAITDEKELGEALKSGADSIEIEGNLKDKVIRIKASGKVAWIVALGAVAVVVILAVFSVNGANIVLVATPVIGAKISIWAIFGAIVVAVAAIIVAMLNKFRRYKLEKISNTRIILRKK